MGGAVPTYEGIMDKDDVIDTTEAWHVALAAYWPTLADVPDGKDVFPHLPIEGIDSETLAALVCGGHIEIEEEGETK